MDWKILHRSSLSTNIQPAIRGRRGILHNTRPKRKLMLSAAWKKVKLLYCHSMPKEKDGFISYVVWLTGWLAALKWWKNARLDTPCFFFLCQIAFWNYRGGVNTYICNNGLLPPIKKPEKVFWFLCCRTLKFRYKLVSLEIKNLALDSRGIFQV